MTNIWKIIPVILKPISLIDYYNNDDDVDDNQNNSLSKLK